MMIYTEEEIIEKIEYILSKKHMTQEEYCFLRGQAKRKPELLERWTFKRRETK